MEFEFHFFKTLSSDVQEEVAQITSDYTNGIGDEQPQMLPATKDQIFDKHAAVVALEKHKKEFAGFVGASNLQPTKNAVMTEVGTLWVPRVYRGYGLATILVQIITSEVSKVAKPFAFCNGLSLLIFHNVGYVNAAKSELPDDAFDLCALCPKKPMTGCCDTPVVHRGE